MNYLTFNRHVHMNSETRSEILNILKDLILLETSTYSTENMLYGFFDGYDYSTEILDSTELVQITKENPQIGNRISDICYIVKDYGKD
jgi:hypothetical protein